ncbi:MAG: hypothetical protein OXQ90_15620 [Gammaproteobacteria bacterium]|nr:hypothetical protein [Gammaproteobacteria bacterium]
MAGLLRIVRFDIGLQLKSFIYPATVVSTGIICGFILVLPVETLSPEWGAFFVFIDPATIGLSFVGAIVLMEKAQRTIYALGISPMRPWVYVASKTISLTLLTFAAGLVVAWVAVDRFDFGKMLVALTLSSTVAVLIGFACVARAPSMNKLMITLLWVTGIAYIPVLAHFDVLPEALTPVVAVNPSYAILVTVLVSIDPEAVSTATKVYGYAYLGAWCVLGWWWTLREYKRYIITDGK